MKWFKIDLTFEQVGQGHLMHIMDKAIVLFNNISNAKDIAIFSSPFTPEGESIFFTPKASEIFKSIIIEYNGVECDTPPKQWDKEDWTSRTTFFAGDKFAYDLLEGDITEPPNFKM